ncbi:MAG: hypothetical protein A3C80_00655 [Candidatus Ryanbacteria bacterium RIFCSPHIGHO2_02_FULL_45_43]|uniref:NIF system FeS cluster assembly NifU C-terminal domain-containing protein n=1 Tax=Candidatus Ryanbacteria bacterium RIFCSPHIGHO2_01_45_13 TaxID=1802112 RepID=A0A1G2FYJ9_9BACT|nr:MAG: hypothetical protein A2718_02045 [Candidatus Ryanbacteria bacterium RIFCSPHIGHO2_01_FULL_44_130]OGZ42690.1 MAG: hypothetical protein A2W41_03020 [Candidatus Ryanbacteria bacterium RIFCSPHIGHO2_01_45_13]OGZ48822.1 MAG: hypothetical protein A3C80_00655 [Candidatus Ryanbacteria bacterium RIFCSPHIGHO2_02_FULL_45_43]OGZ50854.1 MAG: hypothetical protein A3E55_02675 [Candidatus Ryanbacteria bacterium RIFCSPHIGHO2_12_FULL_44_20]OGZ52065.1 MAG: hypothetical protein A3A17_01260 [Candidatus Ryanba
MIEEKLKKVIDEEVKPMVAMHAGVIDFVSFKDGVVHLRLSGACKGCSLSQITLKEGIEEMLKQRFDSVERVEAVE